MPEQRTPSASDRHWADEVCAIAHELGVEYTPEGHATQPAPLRVILDTIRLLRADRVDLAGYAAMCDETAKILSDALGTHEVLRHGLVEGARMVAQRTEQASGSLWTTAATPLPYRDLRDPNVTPEQIAEAVNGECDCDDGTDADEPADRGFICEHHPRERPSDAPMRDDETPETFALRCSLDAERAENDRLRAALEQIADDGCETYSYADCCTKRCQEIAEGALRTASPKDKP